GLISRLHYLSSRSLSCRLLGRDNNERALQGLGKITNIAVVDYRSFIVRKKSFYVLGGDHWLPRALEEDGATLAVVEPAPEGYLFLATLPASPNQARKPCVSPEFAEESRSAAQTRGCLTKTVPGH